MDVKRFSGINPLHPNISIHILHSLCYMFRLVMTWRIGFTIIAWVVIISFILMISTNDLAILLLGEIGCWSLSEFKGLKSVNKPVAISLSFNLSISSTFILLLQVHHRLVGAMWYLKLIMVTVWGQQKFFTILMKGKLLSW